MIKHEEDSKSTSTECAGSSKESTCVKSKGKSRGKKRKRRDGESDSECEDVLADNSVEVDRSLHASAIKNNLDETSVRKIIKKVVTNDRVLALVKMREEEDSGPEDDNLRPKLTRAKVKELRKGSPKTHSATAWNLENLELTPIKHIPVKTRPEVKALIAQELPEDEDDEEYEPTHDDVPSDDDQGLESCSDLDSQPRTPATPRSQHSTSPKVVKDGPFKVPQDVSTPTRRKLDLEEEATIALRTRSKLSLSATSIEHIESTFVPPDDIPMPAVDDLWNQFLNECLNPASTSKNEDDDEADPEYNVAADPDALPMTMNFYGKHDQNRHSASAPDNSSTVNNTDVYEFKNDEDEESLGNSIIKISKKELNDLVTELFNIIPESTTEEELMVDNLASSVLTEHSQTEVSTRWEGKQEPTSDDENGNRLNLSDRITFEKKNYTKVSTGKSELEDKEVPRAKETAVRPKKDVNKEKKKPDERRVSPRKPTTVVRVCIQDDEAPNSIENAPPLLQENLKAVPRTIEFVHIQVNQAKMLPEQVVILQQQLRMHVQLAASSYLQLYVHPIHWSYASKYKEYLEAFSKMVDLNPKSVVNVCNLQPAVELISTWEKTVSANTPENREMIQFIQNEADRCKRRGNHKNLYVGDFHETFLKVVSNSPVFLYPYLLPAMPYRGDMPRRSCYLHSEDQLIAIGMEQFWKYVKDNPKLFPQSPRRGHHGLRAVLTLISQHMMPWLPLPVLQGHVQTVRRTKDKDNPIIMFMKTRVVPPVKHKLLPCNPKMSLYEQPENEVPRIFARYLAKTSKRFRNYLNRRLNKTGVPANGVEVELGQAVVEPSKEPLPIQFSKPIVAHTPAPLAEKFDIQITDNTPKQTTHFYKFVETSSGAYLLPLNNVYTTVNSHIFQQSDTNSTVIDNNLPEKTKTKEDYQKESEHCTCCIQLRKICKQRQTAITDYFSNRKESKCYCKEKKYPEVSNRLRLLVYNFKYNYKRALQELQTKINILKRNEQDIRLNESDTNVSNNNDSDLDDMVYVTNFHLKFLTKTSLAHYISEKRNMYRLFENFNPLEHDAVKLAVEVEKTCGQKLEDLYKEFLCFLTPEQADKINAFKDYFRRNCITDLVKKVEEQVKDLEKRKKILKQLYKVFTKNITTACEICTDILRTLDGYPTLAQYVHSLFPHRKEKSSEQTDLSSPPTPEPATEKPTDETNCDETNCEDITMVEEPVADYKADMSMSEEEDNGGSKSPSDSEHNQEVCRPIKEEYTSTEYVTPTSERVSLHTVVTVSKTEEDSSECSNSSMQIMFEDEIIKTECPEWRRDEDKLILEILKEQLTPEERQDKTILEIVDDKNIIDIIADSLTDKSKEDIRTRILYLLQIC